MRSVKWLIFILCLGLPMFVLVNHSQASVDYHYRYQALTQGASYSANSNLEIKLYINVENEQVQSGNIVVNYDTTVLQLKEVRKWNVFEINVDTSSAGVIKINGTTGTLFSGEAPMAYLYFTTLKEINDPTRVLSLAAGTASPTITPNPTITDQPTNTPVLTIAPVSPTPTPLEPTATLTKVEDIPECPTIEGNGQFVLVVIADQYTNLAEFQADAQTAVNNLKNTNLSTANLSKFTFRYASDISRDYRIRLDAVNADFNVSLARQTQQQCDGDAFLLLSKRYPTRAESFGTGGFSTIEGRMAVVFQHSLFVVPHELGHALPGLFDEYDFRIDAQEAARYYNCSGQDQARCQEWRSKYPDDPQLGCFAVCGYRNWFRSTEFSTMNNNPDHMNYYNTPSLETWSLFLANF